MHEIVETFCVKYCYHVRELTCKIHFLFLYLLRALHQITLRYIALLLGDRVIT